MRVARYLGFPHGNSGLYTALFRYMQTVGRAGCVHTAFELAKLMLHLDPAVDPRRVLLCIGAYDVVCMLCVCARLAGGVS